MLLLFQYFAPNSTEKVSALKKKKKNQQVIGKKNIPVGWGQDFECIHSDAVTHFSLQRYQNIGEESLVNICSWENWKLTSRRMELELCLSCCLKPSSKWIDGLNVD